MSEGKGVLVVSGGLDLELVTYQLKELGIELDVVVQPETAGSIIQDLISKPESHERIKEVLADNVYVGDFNMDKHKLLNEVLRQFQNFEVRHRGHGAIRDLIIHKINEGVTHPRCGNVSKPANPQEDITPSILLEILKEVKGLKEPAPPKTMSTEDRAAIEEATRCFLTKPELSVPNLVEGLRVITNFNVFAKGNPGFLKVPQSKAEFIDVLTAVVNDPSELQLLPPMVLSALSKEDRQAIIDLLHPKTTVVAGGLCDFDVGAFTPNTIFNTLLESIEKGNGNVNFYGLNTLSVEARGVIRDKLFRALEKQPIKVVGGNKEALVEGLVRALKEGRGTGSNICIKDVDLLHDDDVTELVNRLSGWRDLDIPKEWNSRHAPLDQSAFPEGQTITLATGNHAVLVTNSGIGLKVSDSDTGKPVCDLIFNKDGSVTFQNPGYLG